MTRRPAGSPSEVNESDEDEDEDDDDEQGRQPGNERDRFSIDFQFFVTEPAVLRLVHKTRLSDSLVLFILILILILILIRIWLLLQDWSLSIVSSIVFARQSKIDGSLGYLVLPAIMPIAGRGLPTRKGRLGSVEEALLSGRMTGRKSRQTSGAEHASGRHNTFHRKTLD